MPESNYRTLPEDTSGMPRGIAYIVGNEAAERFSYYGMKAILTVFMTKHLLNSAGQPDFMTAEGAKATVGLFGAAVYATPVLGALLADTVLGKYRTIIYLSLVYCLGHAVLALVDVPSMPVEPRSILFVGLGLIALGAGGIKPCVSSHVGDQFNKKNQPLMTRIYGWFYFSINFGSTFSTLLTPVLLTSLGSAWAFGVPGVLMAIATLVFWMGRHEYAHIPPSGTRFWKETFSAEGMLALINLLPLVLLAAPFWCLFDQTASAWVIQAESMDCHFLGMEVGEAQLQAVNPILVMLLVPLFSYGIYPAVAKLTAVTPFRKIAVGMLFTVASFSLVAVVQSWIDQGATPHAWWQVLAYLLLTIGEVLVSITLLEFYYTQAPKAMKSVIMAAFMFSISLGNVVTAVVNLWIERPDGTLLLEGAAYYWFFAGLMLVTTFVFMVWSQFYRGKSYFQGDQAAGVA